MDTFDSAESVVGPADDPDLKTLAVVYQFGKVASTAIVATLDEIEGVEALQSHFLGKRALRDMFSRLLDADIKDYFFEHNLDQLVQNTRLTRRIAKIRRGQSHERLLVLSLSRHPLEWFRSSIVQDVEGYLPFFREFVDRLGIACDDDSEVIKHALTRLFSIYGRMIDRAGGIDAMNRSLAHGPKEVVANSVIENDQQAIFFMYAMMRPFDWFQLHFETALGVSLDEMTEEDGILRLSNRVGDYFVIRYEDLERSLPSCLSEIGLTSPKEIKRQNVSSKKRFAKDIKVAFKSRAAERLGVHFSASDYSRRFGYD